MGFAASGMVARRVAVAAAAVGLVLVVVPMAFGRTLYGYEDSLGMLHTNGAKVNDQYKPLGQGKLDHEALVAALRAQDAIGGPPPPRLSGAVLPVDLGSLSEVGERILQAAKPFLGVPYRLGGDTLAGIDCSGLTKAVFARLGCDLPRQSRLQAACGAPVDQAELAAGDLVFFSTNKPEGINHVAVYLGKGMILHSSASRGGVVVERLPGTRYENWYVTARRLPRSGRPLASSVQ